MLVAKKKNPEGKLPSGSPGMVKLVCLFLWLPIARQ